MNKIVEALKQTGVFYLATIDGDQARVRPVSAVEEIDGHIYISTNRTKEMFKQMMANAFLALAPVIKNWCTKGDGVFDYSILEVFRLENPRAVRYSMNKVPESIEE